MNMTKRCFVRIISFMAAAIVVLGIAAAQSFTSSRQMKRQLEYNMNKSVEDLSASIDNIRTTLEKGIYAGSAQMLGTLSAKLWSDAANAKISLSQLPVSELHLENTYKFLSQVGNYSKSLAEKCGAGEQLSDTDRENLEKLEKYAKTLSDNMWKVENRIMSGELSYEKSSYDVYGAENDSQPEYVTEGFVDFEEGYDNYPTLIYDGPFSDHILEKEPELLKGARQISADEALKTAQKACPGTELTHTGADDEQGKMPSYIFTGENKTAAITQAGGYLSYILGSRDVDSRNMTAAQCVKKAYEFLGAVGIKDMKETYYEIEGNICIINFADVQDGTLLYTDLIKVGVAMDNGEIISYDARGYITNHKRRSLNPPRLSEEEARGTLSPLLDVNKVRRAVIPSSGLNERSCYEFSCQDKNGRTVLVYINADTGAEEQILLLEISENGTLTV